ncbi:MAG TPA: diguanylate cyclase [Smithellaceae bacterium]|nr:diguanylate cyclase [Smithellaceae bacterium]
MHDSSKAFQEPREEKDLLRQAASQYKMMFSNAAEGILAVDSRTRRFLFANPAICRMLGYEEKELLQLSVQDIHPQEALEFVLTEFAALAGCEKDRVFHVPCRRRDGSVFYADISNATLTLNGVACTVGFFTDVTEQKRAEDALKEREIRFKKLFTWVPGMIYQFTRRADGTYCVPFSTEAIRDIFGCSPEDVREDFSAIADVILPEDLGHVIDTIERSAESLTVWSCEYRVQIPGRSVRWISGISTPEKMPDGSITWHGFNTDITERKQMEESILQSEERYRTILEEMADSYYEVDLAGHFTFVNDTMCRQLGYSRDELTGASFRINVVKEDIDYIYKAFDQIYKTGDPKRNIAYRIHHRDGTIRFVENSAFPMRNREGVIIGFRGIGRDVTERRLTEEKIQYLATHDFLTELPNRMMFGHLLHQAVQTAKRYQKQFAVLFIDLDGFKEINDRMGHEAGDRLLKEIAARLKNNLRAADVAARMGGDEFVLLMEEVTDSASVATVARKINDGIAQPFIIHGLEQHITASIGISLYPNDGQDGQTLLTRADQAMYAAKAKGKNHYQFYAEHPPR